MARSCYEIACQKELEAEGYVVDFKTRPFRVSKGYQVDILGCFDILAYRRGELRWISVKAQSHGVRAKDREEIKALRFPSGCVKEIWSYRENGTIRKETIP